MSRRDDADVPMVLVIEPEVQLAQAMVDFLRKDQRYEVQGLASGSQGLGAVDSGGVDLVVVAMDLPDMAGIDMVTALLRKDRDLPVVVLSGLDDVAAAGRCVQRGAEAYLTKPVDPTELANAVEHGLRRRHEPADASARSVAAEGAAPGVAHVRRELEQVITGTLEMVMSTYAATDPTLVGHSQRVAALAATVADELGLSDEEVEEVRLAGRFHDLGKIGIPNRLLEERDTATEEDRHRVREHAAIGADILAGIEHLGRVSTFVRSHHEHWDGSGYPDGLRGEEIPVGARILCAVEVFDALTTAGTDRAALSPVDAVRRMMDLEGSILDPQVLVAVADVVASQRNLPFLVEPDQRVNASGIVMIPDQ